MKPISVSPSKLNLYLDCKRCFHDAYASKCPKPRGIFPSLPGGMDLALKKFVDNYRGSLPKNLEGRLPGVLWDDPRMNKWRHWRTGPTYENTEHQVKCIGALDDMLVVNGGQHVPLDWKTKGSEPKDDGSQYYQNQLDCYCLMGGANGLDMADFAYLVYVWPDCIVPDAIAQDQNSFGIRFGFTPFKIMTNPKRAEEIIIKAAECLRGPRPDPVPSCEHCRYMESAKYLGTQQTA